VSRRAQVVTLLAACFAVAVADGGSAGCIQVRPERELWIEIATCSTDTVARASEALFIQSLEQPSHGNPRAPVERARELVQRWPAVLVEAQALAYLEIPTLVTKLEPSGSMRQELEGVGARWQPAESPEIGPFLVYRSSVTCAGLERGARLVVRQASSCCDVSPPSDLPCLLALRAVQPSARAAPGDDEVELDRDGRAP